MTVFEELRNGQAYDIRDEKDQKEVHGEIDRCDHLCWQINTTDPADKEKVTKLENELLNGQIKDGTFITPPIHIDCASSVHLGKNVYTLLQGSAFEPLKDEKIFSNPVIFHGVITWDNGEIDIAPETVYKEDSAISG